MGVVTVVEGAELLADVIEGIARASAAAQMLGKDVAAATAAGQTDIPDAAVNEARKYAVARGDSLQAKLDAEASNAGGAAKPA